jgi:3-deoxy-D-manno-octulosonic-acid transferase
VRRSAGVAGRDADRYLLDTIGELRAAYSLADVVVVGRSFGDQFGSDPIEPIALGKATVIGPAVSDFARIVETFEAAGGIVRTTREALGAVLDELVADDDRRRRLGEAGRACVRAQQGASARHAELLLSLLGSREAS